MWSNLVLDRVLLGTLPTRSNHDFGRVNKNTKLIPGSCNRCGHCNQCKFILETDQVKDNKTGSVHAIIGNITCNTSNIIYGINCSQCDKLVYIGETGRKLKKRTYEHVYNIKTKKDTLVSEHFNMKDHNIIISQYLVFVKYRPHKPKSENK